MTPQIKKLTTSEVIEDKMKRMDSGVEGLFLYVFKGELFVALPPPPITRLEMIMIFFSQRQ